MNKIKHEDRFENVLEQYYASPSPRESFVIRLEKKLLTEKGQPTGLFGGIRSRNTFRPSLIIVLITVFTLLISLIIAGPVRVQAAIENLLEYIPGFGLVEQEGSIKTLINPVSQTREGVTLTIQAATLSEEKTGFVFTVDGLQAQAIAGDNLEAQKKACWAAPFLRLVDGKEISSNGGGSYGYDADQNYRKIVFYPPLPEDIDQAAFVLPCIEGTIIGKSPENWELLVNFVQAIPDGTMRPVEGAEPSSASDDPMRLNTVIETDTGFIFIGEFQALYPNSQVAEDSKIAVPTIMDAAGKMVPYRIPSDLLAYGEDDRILHWVYETQTKDIQWPVTIQFNTVGIACYDDQAQFELDAGTHPAIGKVWDVDKALSAGSCSLRVISVKRNYNGYTFLINGLVDSLRNLGIEIVGFQASGIAVREFPGYQEYRLVYEDEVPEGDLRVLVSGVTVDVLGPWGITWRPDGEE
jgi:hypothetical protein